MHHPRGGNVQPNDEGGLPRAFRAGRLGGGAACVHEWLDSLLFSVRSLIPLILRQPSFISPPCMSALTCADSRRHRVGTRSTIRSTTPPARPLRSPDTRMPRAATAAQMANSSTPSHLQPAPRSPRVGPTPCAMLACQTRLAAMNRTASLKYRTMGTTSRRSSLARTPPRPSRALRAPPSLIRLASSRAWTQVATGPSAALHLGWIRATARCDVLPARRAAMLPASPLMARSSRPPPAPGRRCPTRMPSLRGPTWSYLRHRRLQHPTPLRRWRRAQAYSSPSARRALTVQQHLRCL